MDSNLSFLSIVVMLVSSLYGTVTASPANDLKNYTNYVSYELKGEHDVFQTLLNEVYPNNAPKVNNDDVIWAGVSSSTIIKQYFFIISPRFMEQFESYLKGKKITKEIISNNYAAFIKTEQALPGAPFSWTAYYDLPDIHKYLHDVSVKHNIVKVVNAGNSYEKRPILGVRINTGGACKPAFMIECGIHAREWISPASCTYFINQLLTTKDPEIVPMRDQFDWHIFPVVNPDGYHYTHTTDRFWRKNRSKSPSGCHGVDLNRNWPSDTWGVYGASNDSCDYQLYTGPEPFSEPETKALRSYISSISDLQAYVTVHSDGQELLIPYDCCDGHVSNYDDLKKIGNTSLDYAYNVNNVVYYGPGTAGELDYKSSGESMDWVRKTFDTPVVFTIEMRGSNYDWPPAKIYQQGAEFTQMILGMVTEANALGYFQTAKKPVAPSKV